MKKLLLLLSTILTLSLYAQNIDLTVSENETPAFYESLTKSTSAIVNDKLLNQQIVDLVEPFTIDSTYKRKFERHRVVGGGMIRMLGFRWLTVNHTREKFVGVVNRYYIRSHDGEKFTEYDINYDLVPHLPKYLELSHEAYQKQMGMAKSRKGDKKGKAPYIPHTEGIEHKPYKFHCELTPPRDYRYPLNLLFYPVHTNNKPDVHPNMEMKDPVLGMYGPLVLDCNHRCHPEIHPYEWIWWLDPTEKRSKTKTWWVGLMRDVSNRFKHWSDSPRTGVVSIPFAFPMDSEDWTISVNHQLFNGFNDEDFKQLVLPSKAQDFKTLEKTFALSGANLTNKKIQVNANLAIPYGGIQYWLDELNYDANTGLVTGNMHLALSVHDIYTCSISTSYSGGTSASLMDLKDQMTGTFSSALQADSDTDYYDISLQMQPIWEDSQEGQWLYVEQALGKRPEKPYRQRIYELTQIDETTFSSKVYLLPDAEAAIGKWNDVSFFEKWSPEDITLKEGCAVMLTLQADGSYVGSTNEKNCNSTLYGASYATSEVSVYADKIVSWDRGFDANDEHIWGAEKGGYIFNKITQ